MPEELNYDVFLSHSSKDKDIVRPLAERLRADRLRVWFDEWEIKPGDNIPAKVEAGLEQSRMLVLCMSAQAFGSDWARLESYTFRFRDPLNQERRFIPLRLDAAPIKGSLAQFLYINWLSEVQEQEYAKLFEACRPLLSNAPHYELQKRKVFRGHKATVTCVAVTADGRRAVSGSKDKIVRVWDVEIGSCLATLEGHTDGVWGVAVRADGRQVISGSEDKTVRVWDVETGQCLATLEGHTDEIDDVAVTADWRRVISGSRDNTVRVWDVETGQCLATLEGHTTWVNGVGVTADGLRAVSGSLDNTVRVWDVETSQCLATLRGHTSQVVGVAITADGQRVVSGSGDKTVRVWDVETSKCLATLEGHTAAVPIVALAENERWVFSCSYDKTIRVWDLETGTGQCLATLEGHSQPVMGVAVTADGRRVISCSEDMTVRVWELPPYEERVGETAATTHYTNAKVILTGDSGAGKTGLSRRLALKTWEFSDSTVGAWATQWKLPVDSDNSDEREIWLWDFGGQADQRLVHQLYMDRTALILLLFDADKEDVLPGLREWQTALRRCVPSETPLVLVAGRIDAGFRASRAKLQQFAQEQGFRFFETSAKDGTNCEELSRAITEGIPWAQMEKRTSPRIFKLIKDHILKLRDEGEVLMTFKELREKLWQRLADEPRFDDATLETVIGLLDGPGAVKELDYGTYILLQPEWVNAYAQAVIRTLRQDPTELGCLPLRSIAEGRLLFQTVERDGSIAEMKRLLPADERVVLREMERQLEERGLCLRQGDKLVFPSHCGRERPAVVEHPAVFVSYAVQGYLDDIYATLVVKLADSESFKLKELWRDAADFVTLAGAHHMGIKLTRAAASHGDISVYFAPGVSEKEQAIFANYIHKHLQDKCDEVLRLRHYVCPHCHAPKGNPQVLMQKLLAKKTKAEVVCDSCDKSFGLWDELERLFASEAVRQQVEGLQAADAIRLDARRKGKLLALEVAARIASADQKCFEIPATEDEGLDMELEFTDDDGKGTGRRLYLQLKSGNSHLERRKDGREIFRIKEQRWVNYWLKQPHPVMLVIGTFAVDDERFVGKDKLEFADVRWMEISSVLQRESANGTKPVKQIEFKGERLDMTSIRRWRDAASRLLP